MNNKATFFERLKAWRKTAGFSQEEMAKRLGVSRSYLNQVEKGKRSPGERLVNTFSQLSRSGISARIREDPPDAGRAAAFELVFEKMPLLDLMNQIMGLVNDRTETRAQSIETVKPLLEVLQRRLEKLK